MSSSPTVDEPSGHGEDLAPQRRCGGELQVRSGQAPDGPGQVVSYVRQRQPGGVGHEVPGRQTEALLQRLADEDPSVRVGVVRVLAGRSGERVTRELLERLTDENPFVPESVVEVLAGWV